MDAREYGSTGGRVSHVAPSSATDVAEAILAEYDELWHGDFSKLDVAADSIVLHDPGAPGGVLHGRDALQEHIEEMRSAFPDLTLELGDVVANDGIVMAEATVTGTFEGELYGAPPTGRSMAFTGVDKLVIEDGEVREHRIYYDQKEMLAQLGLTFPDVLFLLPRMIGAKIAGGF